MELTEKCKKDFEKWFNDKYLLFTTRVEQKMFKMIEFYDSPQSMQYGVYIDFFDSVLITIIVDTNIENNNTDNFSLYIGDKKDGFTDYGSFKNRQEARIEAIKKVNEIYNNK